MSKRPNQYVSKYEHRPCEHCGATEGPKLDGTMLGAATCKVCGEVRRHPDGSICQFGQSIDPTPEQIKERAAEVRKAREKHMMYVQKDNLYRTRSYRSHRFGRDGISYDSDD